MKTSLVTVCVCVCVCVCVFDQYVFNSIVIIYSTIFHLYLVQIYPVQYADAMPC
jgi:hypothetical protein